MPSPIGHVLAGLALGLALGPNTASPRVARRLALGLPAGAWIAAAVAASPDLDLLIPNFHRSGTHSLAATALVMIIAAGVTGKVTGRVQWRWVLLAGAAHASHILLDWLGKDRYPPAGIAVFWPFSHRFLVSGWDIFPPTERRLWIPGAFGIDLRAALTEVAILGPVAALAEWVRRTGRTRVQTSGPGARRPPSA